MILDTAQAAETTPRSSEGQGDTGLPRPVLELSGLTLRYGRQLAVEAVSLVLRAGDRVAVVGPNGAGKSSLFKAITGILTPSAGSIRVHGHGPGQDTCVAYVPQRSAVDWSFPLTVADVVMMGRAAQVGLMRRPGAEDHRRVAASLEVLRLGHLADRRIAELTGGQQQRMFIARALAQDAELVLMDEPFSGLDAPSREDVLSALDDLDARGVAVLLATHDLRLASERFEQVLLLNHRLVAYGPPDVVITDANLHAAFGGRMHAIETQHGKIFFGDAGCEEHDHPRVPEVGP